MSLTGEPVGSILTVELRAYGYDEEMEGILYLRPVFDGSDEGSDHTFGTTSTAQWSEYFDITKDTNAPSSWSWSDVENLDCTVESIDGTIWYCSRVEVRVTYDRNPMSGIPYPTNGATGVELTPLLNITVTDPDGDAMDIVWLSNSSGSWQSFGMNSSVSNGTYHQIFSNASENGKWWFWRVNVSDVGGYVLSSIYTFYTGYQSKITNMGSTNLSGYLLMQIHYYNTTSTEWEGAFWAVNETTPRTINASDQLGLDTVFNGLVNTNDLSLFGSGTYRVYAAFRDPDGNVLVCDDETLLEAAYEFTITFE